MCGLGGLDVVHGTQGHREGTLPPGSSCGTRFLLSAEVNDREDDEGQKNEGVETHNPEHDRDEAVEFVQGVLSSRRAI